MTLRPIGEAFGNHKHATGVRGRCARTLARFVPAGRATTGKPKSFTW